MYSVQSQETYISMSCMARMGDGFPMLRSKTRRTPPYKCKSVAQPSMCGRQVGLSKVSCKSQQSARLGLLCPPRAGPREATRTGVPRRAGCP